MKILKSILPVLSVLLLAACGCKKEEGPQYTLDPAIEIILESIKGDGIVISVKSLNTEAIYGIVKEKSETAPTAEEIEEDGVKAEEGKIVIGRRVIDAETGTWVDLEEPGLARRIPTGLGWVRQLWHFLRGRSFGRRG